MCVWLSLFQLAWNSRSRSDSRRYAWRGGLVLVCEQGTLTFCGCTWLSEHVCLCLHSGWRRTLDLLHLSGCNKCIWHEDVKEKQQYNYLLEMKLFVLVNSAALTHGFSTAHSSFVWSFVFHVNAYWFKTDWIRQERPWIYACFYVPSSWSICMLNGFNWTWSSSKDTQQQTRRAKMNATLEARVFLLGEWMARNWNGVASFSWVNFIFLLIVIFKMYICTVTLKWSDLVNN